MKNYNEQLQILRFGVHKYYKSIKCDKRQFTMRIGRVINFNSSKRQGLIQDLLDDKKYGFYRVNSNIYIMHGDLLVFYLFTDYRRPGKFMADRLQSCIFTENETSRIIEIIKNEIPNNLLEKFQHATPGVSFRAICFWTREYIRKTDQEHTLDDTKLILRLYKAFMEYAIHADIRFIEKYEKQNLLDICAVSDKYYSELLYTVFDFNSFELEELIELINSGVEKDYILKDVSEEKWNYIL